jgi:uncharacterized membrane protein YhaH (DUF805 family)
MINTPKYKPMADSPLGLFFLPAGKSSRILFLIASLFAAVLISIGDYPLDYIFNLSALYWLQVALSLLGAYISIVAVIRRLHDLNLTSLLALLSFVPLVNVIFFLYLLFAPGQ